MARPKVRSIPAERAPYIGRPPWRERRTEPYPVPMGNSSVDCYGSDRSEAENEFATSLVALEHPTTGEGVGRSEDSPA